MFGEREKGRGALLRDSAFTFLSPRDHPEGREKKGEEREGGTA